MGRSLLLVDFGFGGGGITAAGLDFSVEEGVDYFPIVKWADGAVERVLTVRIASILSRIWGMRIRRFCCSALWARSRRPRRCIPAVLF